MSNYYGVFRDKFTRWLEFGFNTPGSTVITGMYHKTVTWSPSAVSANTTAEQTVTVTGLQLGDVVVVNKPTAQAGLGIVGARVSAANTLAVTFANVTASPITPTASEVYSVSGLR